MVKNSEICPLDNGDVHCHCAKGSKSVDLPAGGDKRVLLHTCCAPCSSAIIEWMLANGITPTIYYCNPNIYPYGEYEIRKNECTRYARSLGLEIVDADYDHENWLKAVAGLEVWQYLAHLSSLASGMLPLKRLLSGFRSCRFAADLADIMEGK